VSRAPFRIVARPRVGQTVHGPTGPELVTYSSRTGESIRTVDLAGREWPRVRAPHGAWAVVPPVARVGAVSVTS
jgi:hypothetical protein